MKREKKGSTGERIASFLAFEAVCHTLWVWYMAGSAYENGANLSALVKAQAMRPNLILLTLTALVYLAAVRFLDLKKTAEQLFRYRYPIAAGLFVLCVAFGVSGSSIGMFSALLGREDTDLLLGVDRAIRSDEWAVWTPMVASQYLNPTGHFSYFSTVLRAAPTDVFLEYGTPVLSWISIFRPFHLGFLFLPLANGMAFFWAGRQIALVLVSFAFGRMLTEDDRGLSCVYAGLVAFSPVVQWWFAINGLVEMLIFLQLSILALRTYLRTERIRVKLLCMATAVLCAGGYALTMYPSWMIPLAYVLLALGVWTVMEERHHIRLGRVDALLAVAAVAVLAAAFGYVYQRSGDTIRIIMGTVYPGARFETGGGALSPLFTSLTNLWSGLKGEWPPTNVCENAGVLSLFPLSLLLLLVLSIRGRVDALCRSLLVAEALLWTWCVFGFPAPLAKLSLLSHAQSGRAVIAFQFCDLMLLFRELKLLREVELKRRHCVLLTAPPVLLCCGVIQMQYSAFYSGKLLLLTGLVGGALCVLLLLYTQGRGKRLLCLVIAGVVLVSGIIVNPVRLGMESVLTLPEVQMIRETVQQDPEAIWVVANEGFLSINLPLLAGARTINSSNVYPTLERWRHAEEVYNRYAHILVDLSENTDEERFQLLYADQFKVRLSPEDLRSLGVTYLLTTGDLSEEQFRLVAAEGAQKIYQLKDGGAD